MVTAAPRYENPERLKRLQQLFDDIWAELMATGSPDVAPEVAVTSRDRLALLVVKHVGSSDRDAESIRREILASFSSAPQTREDEPC